MDTSEAYATLSDLIFKGFLTAEFDLDGKLLIFKTINNKEFDLVKIYAGNPKRADYQHRFNVFFIIFSLFIIDNENVLTKREKQIAHYYEMFVKLPSNLIRQFIVNLNDIRLISFEALKYIEGFCYTDVSRTTWRTLRDALPCNSEFTGIPGTTEMGINTHQGSWILINRALDFEEINNGEVSRAMMIASASNPKGVRQIRSQHDSSTKMVEDRRKKLAKEGFIDVKKWSEDGWAASVDTTEELVAELERQMTGVKDKHDLFMEKYLKQVKDEADKKTKAAEENINKYRDNYDNVFIDGTQRELTKEETLNLMNKKNETVEEVESEEATSPEDKDKFYKKIGVRELTGK